MIEITKEDLLYADKIISKVFKVSPTNVIYDDLRSIAYERLFLATKDFDKSKGVKLQTVRYKYIVWGICQFLLLNYAKEFNSKDIHIEQEYAVDMLTYLANREDTAKVITEIERCFTKGESTIFSDWVLGEPTNLIIHKYGMSKWAIHRLINSILEKAKECSQT